MVIKAVRVRTSAGAGELAQHLTNAEDNEAVEIVQGTLADLQDAVVDARRFGRTYAIRHFIVAPQLDVNRQQFLQVVALLGAEFGFDPALPFIVQHTKTRAVPDVAGQHWHIVVPEINPATGQVLSSRFDHARHEKIARQAEIMFNHPIIAGAHNVSVLAALRKEGKTDIAAQLAVPLGPGERPAAAFTSIQHQSAKRGGIDLAIVRENIRAACADKPTGAELRQRLTVHGLAISRGEKVGTWVVLGPDGQFLGAAHRLAGQRKTDFNANMEKDYDNPSATTDGSTTDLWGHADPTAGRGNDSGTRTEHSVADERGEYIGHRRDAGPAANDREPDGTGRSKPRSGSPETGPARDSQRLTAHDRNRLISAINNVAVSVMALTRSCNAHSPAKRAEQRLAALEHEARARIAAGEARQNTSVSSRLLAARIYKEASEATYAEVLKAYRAAQEREASMPTPQRNILDKLMGRHVDGTGAEAIERELAALHAQLIVADRTALGAVGNLARAEKDEAAERMSHLGEVEAERRTASEALGDVMVARQLVRVFPSIVYCGPAFVSWAGSRIAGKRRRHEPVDPQARNIWGLPVDFG